MRKGLFPPRRQWSLWDLFPNSPCTILAVPAPDPTSLPAELCLGIKLSPSEFLPSSDSVLCYQKWLIKRFPTQNCQKLIQTEPGDPKPEDFPEPGLDPTVPRGV